MRATHDAGHGCAPPTSDAAQRALPGRRLVSRHRSSVGLRWPSKRIAALHRLPIRSVLAARCALRCAPMAARSLRHLIRDATLAAGAVVRSWMKKNIANEMNPENNRANGPAHFPDCLVRRPGDTARRGHVRGFAALATAHC
ncbi:hypothetical protein D5043_13015 [Verminephrobacter eiseniae]|nr:hypothetical protein [Verminephrobacter eiseniae]MCW5302830.1 hypothetical protein [Verminephrobacter eiseniae]